MSRKTVEKAIVKSIIEKLDGSFEKVSEDLSNSVNHYFTFTRNIPGSTITLTIRFYRSHMMHLDASLGIKNKQIEEFLLGRGANMSSTSAITNDVDYIIWRGEHPVRFLVETAPGGVDNINVDRAATRIVDHYFKFVLSIESNLDTLEKLQNIFHSKDIVSEEKVIPLYYCTPMQNQILVGIALAELLKPANYNFIVSQYERYLTEHFPPGKDEKADLALRLIHEARSRA